MSSNAFTTVVFITVGIIVYIVGISRNFLSDKDETKTNNMTCSIPDCPNIAERSGVCASHAREIRKNHANSLKPPKAKKPIDKVGKKNTFECSDGERVTDSQVRQRLGEAYYRRDLVYTNIKCEGCESELATCHAHIIPKARCKQLKKTELIWDDRNFFNSCWFCNDRAENVSSPAIMQLKNYPRIKAFLELHDGERFCKLPDYSIANEPHKI